MTAAAVEIERRDDGIAIVWFNRPRAHNAMNDALLSQLAERSREVAADDSIRAVVITGRGPSFSVGGDVRWMANHPESPSRAVHILAGWLHEAILEIRTMAKPVIAAVNGAAAGAGMSFTLACDLRVMAANATMTLAYPSRGLSFDGGSSFTLPRLVGLARTLEIVAFDESIDAERALDWGLTTRVVDEGKALEAALEVGRTLAAGSPHAFGAAKNLLVNTFGTTLSDQLDQEREALAGCAAHPDGIEGIDSFLEKRAATFTKAS